MRQSGGWIGGAVLILVLGSLWKRNSNKRRPGYELPNAGNDREEQPNNEDEQPAELPPKTDFQFVLSKAALFKDILPLIGFLLLPGFALRALAVARFDSTVAIALVQFTQPVNFVLAFLLEALSVYIFAIGLLTLFWFGRWYSTATSGRPLPVMGAFLLNLVCSIPIILQCDFQDYMTYIPILLIAPGIAFITGVRWRLEAQSAIWAYRLILLLITVVVAVSGRMWLAPEVLTIRGIPPKTEYVLQQQDQDLIIYDRGLNAVLRMPKAGVLYRQFCDRGPYFTISEYIFGRSHGRPPCPDSPKTT